jgi:hypothetical protein
MGYTQLFNLVAMLMELISGSCSRRSSHMFKN